MYQQVVAHALQALKQMASARLLMTQTQILMMMSLWRSE